MTQATLRTWHRRIGAAIALFVVLQAASGFVLVAGDWAAPEGHQHEGESAALETLALIHHGHFPAGARPLFDAYRLLLATGLVWMALSGGWIALLVRRGRRP